MSAKGQPRYIGHPDGADIKIPYKDGDVLSVHVPYDTELPEEVGGRKVPADFKNSLLEQEANWTVKRDQPPKKDAE